MKKFIIIPVLALSFIFAGTAHAGFFDWFKNTPLNQEAQVISAAKSKGKTDSSEGSEKAISYKLEGRRCREVITTTQNGVITEVSGDFVSDSYCGVHSASDPSGGNTNPSVISFEKPIIYGAKGEEVEKLQAVLKAKGYLSNEIDGKYGSATQKALKKFQNDNGISANGISVGSKTREVLNTVAKAFPGLVVSQSVPLRKCLPTDEPWIQITSPQGGEVYSEGDTVPVKWRTCHTSAQSQLYFDIYNQVEQISINTTTGVDSLSATGTVNYTIPQGFLSSQGWDQGQYYNMHVKSGPVPYNGDFVAVEDFSDNLFTITNGSTSSSCSNAMDVVRTTDSPTGSVIGDDDASLLKFRIKNDGECMMVVNKIAVIPASSDGLPFVNKNDLKLTNVTNGGQVSVTNINPPYSNTVAWFTVNATIPSNGHVDFLLKTMDVEYHVPFNGGGNMVWGGVAYGVGQVDYELYGSNVQPPSWLTPVWGNILTVLP